MTEQEIRVWAELAQVGEYLAAYDDEVEGPDLGSRCGYSDAELTGVRARLGRRGLALRADDHGLVVQAREVAS